MRSVKNHDLSADTLVIIVDKLLRPMKNPIHIDMYVHSLVAVGCIRISNTIHISYPWKLKQ